MLRHFDFFSKSGAKALNSVTALNHATAHVHDYGHEKKKMCGQTFELFFFLYNFVAQT